MMMVSGEWSVVSGSPKGSHYPLNKVIADAAAHSQLTTHHSHIRYIIIFHDLVHPFLQRVCGFAWLYYYRG